MDTFFLTWKLCHGNIETLYTSNTNYVDIIPQSNTQKSHPLPENLSPEY